MIEALKFLYDLDIVGQDIDFNNPMARPRIPHEVGGGGWRCGLRGREGGWVGGWVEGGGGVLEVWVEVGGGVLGWKCGLG